MRHKTNQRPSLQAQLIPKPRDANTEIPPWLSTLQCVINNGRSSHTQHMMDARHFAIPGTYIIATRVILSLCMGSLMVIFTQPIIIWEESLNE